MVSDFRGLKVSGMRVTVDVHAIDPDAAEVANNDAPTLEGILMRAVDQALADQISGAWACAIKVTRLMK